VIYAELPDDNVHDSRAAMEEVYASSLMTQTLVNGKWFMKSLTYMQSSVSIPSGSAGNQQLLLQIRATSLKSLIHMFGRSGSAATANGYYDAINCQLTSRQMQIGGSFFPTKPLNDCAKPAESYPYLIAALVQGGSLIKNMGTSVTVETYNSAFPAIPSGSDSRLNIPASGLRPLAGATDVSGSDLTLIKNGSCAFYGYDCEKSSSVLFSGINSRSAPPFLNLYLSGTGVGTNTILCNAWGIVDCILEFDVMSKSVVAYV
jgi:hypothetical protein